MNFPVHAEFYNCFESILLTQAKRLVEDIAKHQNTDSKELWNLMKPQIKVSLFDTELDESAPMYCSHPCMSEGGAIRTRCRAPCLIGFEACPRHVQIPRTTEKQTLYESVDRVLDFQGQVYFVDTRGIARDKLGQPKGQLDAEGVLLLFEKGEKPDSWTPPLG